MTQPHYLLSESDRNAILDMQRKIDRDLLNRGGSVNSSKSEIDSNDVHIALPIPAGGIPARNGLNTGFADCQVWKIDKDNIAKPLILAHPSYRVHNLSDQVLPKEYMLVHREKYGRWIAGTAAGQRKARVCMRGILDQTLNPGEGGTMSGLVCLWNPDEVEITAPLDVVNLTDQVLELNRMYEACYNCQCKFVITNCCPQVILLCPNCQYQCADNYDVTLTGFAGSGCECLEGAIIPLPWKEECVYDIPGVDPYIITACEALNWDGINPNPCECGGTMWDPCVPDLEAEPQCAYCNGGNVGLPCSYCLKDCGHGLREIIGSLICVSNNWQLNLFIGTAGPCPEVDIWITSNNYSHPASGKCPPRQMTVDVVSTNGCSDVGLRCPSFTTALDVTPRND